MRSAAAALLTLGLAAGMIPDACGQSATVVESSQRGVNGLSEYGDSAKIYRKGTPMHVRASLLYNYHLKAQSLGKKYEAIREGDKIKFLYLKVPNSIGENCIAFIGSIPAEFGLQRFIDYDTMFQKSFLEPLNTILEGMGWSAKPQATLADLFN